MVIGTSALQDATYISGIYRNNQISDDIWTAEQYKHIVNTLSEHGCEILFERNEYTLFKEVVDTQNDTQVKNLGKTAVVENTVISRVEGSGVISPICDAEGVFDTELSAESSKPFLAPLNIQKAGSIAQVIPSFKVIQSDKTSINIGFDTEFQDFRDGSEENRRVLSLQMTLAIDESLIRYFFLVKPNYQTITKDGGQIPLKYCITDILNDQKRSALPDLPTVHKKNIVYHQEGLVDYHEMRENVVPITIISHTGKADISVFRRTKYDTDIISKIGEIQGGWMSTRTIYIKTASDENRNYYWLVTLNIRDTLGLTPADHKSLKSLGKLIKRPKIELDKGVIEHMSSFAVSNPIDYYNYAMNDADIVVTFCSELFLRNRAVPMTLSSAAATAMYQSIKSYFGVRRKADYDRIYRGLELLDEGMIPSKDECLKFLKATRYVPISSNPDAKLISMFFEEAYTGGFNASFYIGWITKYTTDFDLQNAYPTAMAVIVDIDWSEHVRDLPRDYLRLQDLINPLVPSVAVGDFEFPEDCYCPNIPVPVAGGMKIYPRTGKNVYMAGPDMWLALQLGAKIKVHRGFVCQVLEKNGKPSQCLAHAVTNLVQDRIMAKKLYKDNPLVEKSLKTMVNSCYGKTAQNVSPKTRYNAQKMGRVDAEPSTVTSPYHATYTTALVRCMLIGCINQRHDMGYNVYSVTTDGFITDASIEVVRGLDAFGFAKIFQAGRYMLNQTCEACEANQVWEPKHYNDIFLNITTRGNVAVNDEGVLAHNSLTTGEIKDSRADRDALLIAVLARNGKIKCSTKVWTQFSEIVERKHDFHVSETIRELSMNFDYKRCPIVETAVDTPVHYESVDGRFSVDTVIAEYDTRPFLDVEEFLNYRKTMKNEPCVKVKSDLERVRVKSTVEINGYIGKDLNRKILLSILMGYRAGIYEIPILDGAKQSEIVEVVNAWGISQITLNDWKNCSRAKRQENMLPRELVQDTLEKIGGYAKEALAEAYEVAQQGEKNYEIG